MSTNDDLAQAIENFRSVESRLAELVEETESVAGAGERLVAAEGTLKDLYASIEDSLERNGELSDQLATLTRELAETIEVVRRGDPSRMFEAVERLTSDFERHKERINEMAGELRVRIEEAARSIDVSVADSAEEITKVVDERASALTVAVDQARAEVKDSIRKSDEAAEQRLTAAQRQLWIPAIAAAALSAIAVVLLIVVLVVN